MTSKVKAYVEGHIDALEQQRISETVYECPTDIVKEYANILTAINIEIPLHIRRYLSLVDCLHRHMNSFSLWNYEVNGGSEEYTFKTYHPVNSTHIKELNHEISHIFFEQFVRVDSQLDYSTQCITLSVTLFPIQRFII